MEGRSNKAYREIVSSGTGVDYRRKVKWVIQAPEGISLEIVAQTEPAGAVRTQFQKEGSRSSKDLGSLLGDATNT
ncbi:MAG: hypothetical protein ACUVRV_06350 [Cyanobacteriota bacterium]